MNDETCIQSQKPKLWHPKTIQYRRDVLAALNDFITAARGEGNDYEIREVVDVAMREYLKLPEPTDG